MRTHLKAIASLMVLTMFLAFRFAQPAAGQELTPTLTAQDYSKILQLLASYGPAIDSADRNGKTWAELFTPDGRHVCGTCKRVNPYAYISGPEALAKFATKELMIGGHNGGGEIDGGISLKAMPPNGGKKENNPAHMITNVFLQPVPGGVNSRSYFMSQQVIGNGPAVSLHSGGVFFDFIVKTDQGWRFKHKNIVFVGFTIPNSLAPSFSNLELAAPVNNQASR